MVECPVCHASNPPGSLACLKCSTPIEIDDATNVINPVGEGATVLEPAGTPGDPDGPSAGQWDGRCRSRKSVYATPMRRLSPAPCWATATKFSNALAKAAWVRFIKPGTANSTSC